MRCPSISDLLGCTAALGMCLSAGCSFTFIETVPDEPEKLRYFDCTSTPGLPVADGVFALSNGVSGVIALTQSKDEYADNNDGANRNVVAGVSIGVAAIGIASGIYGLVQTERCRTAKAALERRLIPPAEREQKKLTPTPGQVQPAPTAPGAMPGAPTSVEPASEAPRAPSWHTPAGVPQPSTTPAVPVEPEPAPEIAPPTAAPAAPPPAAPAPR
jgi:hypothetical protein